MRGVCNRCGNRVMTCHPTARGLAEYHIYQKRLMASGILPPRGCMEQTVTHSCGASFRVSDRGVTRHVYGADVLYTSLCDCGSHITVWEAVEGGVRA